MPTIADLVRIYVKQRPHIQEALEDNIVNYSALARKISKKIDGSPEAIKIALMRISREFIKKKKIKEQKILKVLKGSSLEIKSKIVLVISEEELDIPTIATAKGPSAYTNIIEESDFKKIKKKRLIKTQNNLTLITIISSEDIEKTPGVVEYLLKTIANENINLIEVISCYRDTLLVTTEVDTPKLFQMLSEKLR